MSVAIKPTRTRGPEWLIARRTTPKITMAANTPSGTPAARNHGRFSHARYHATAIADAGSVIANTSPGRPATETTCSSGTNPTCQYPGLPHVPSRELTVKTKLMAVSRNGYTKPAATPSQLRAARRAISSSPDPTIACTAYNKRNIGSGRKKDSEDNQPKSPMNKAAKLAIAAVRHDLVLNASARIGSGANREIGHNPTNLTTRKDEIADSATHAAAP